MNEKIKPEFNQAAGQSKKEVTQNTAHSQGHGSSMVRQSQPVPVPKPPAMAQGVTEASFNRRWGKEDKAAAQRNEQVSRIPKPPVIDLKHQQEGARLREKFQKAARRDQDRGR